MRKCNYIRPDGRPCPSAAISGQAQCSSHRLDGGPRPLGSRLKHGLQCRTRRSVKSKGELAEQLVIIHRLQLSLDREESSTNFLRLSAEIGRRIEQIFALLEEEVAGGGEGGSALLHAAVERGVPAVLGQERAQQSRSCQGRVRYASTRVRSQRYWAVYGVIVWFARVRLYSASHRQIGKLLNINRGMVACYLGQLERDGLIYRLRGRVLLSSESSLGPISCC